MLTEFLKSQPILEERAGFDLFHRPTFLFSAWTLPLYFTYFNSYFFAFGTLRPLAFNPDPDVDTSLRLGSTFYSLIGAALIYIFSPDNINGTIVNHHIPSDSIPHYC
jgi:hypothetical protein